MLFVQTAAPRYAATSKINNSEQGVDDDDNSQSDYRDRDADEAD
jgi:hypothetical protein